VADLSAVADPPARTTADLPDAAADPPAGKQLKIDGMPVTDEYVIVTGRIRVSRSAVQRWKLGKPMELTVTGIIDSRRQKAKRNGGEATGELEQQHVLQVLDLVLDDE